MLHTTRSRADIALERESRRENNQKANIVFGRRGACLDRNTYPHRRRTFPITTGLRTPRTKLFLGLTLHCLRRYHDCFDDGQRVPNLTLLSLVYVSIERPLDSEYVRERCEMRFHCGGCVAQRFSWRPRGRDSTFWSPQLCSAPRDDGPSQLIIHPHIMSSLHGTVEYRKE